MNIKNRDPLYVVIRYIFGSKAHTMSVHPTLELAEAAAGVYTQQFLHQTKLSKNEFSFEVQPTYFYQESL